MAKAKGPRTPRVRQSIHDRMKEQTELAAAYAQDGAFHSASRILEQLAKDVKQHAEWCDSLLEGES